MVRESYFADAAVRRWQLAEDLRALRAKAGLTSEQVIALLGKSAPWSRPKLSRIENQEQGIRPAEVDLLLDLYGVAPDDEVRERLKDLAATPRDKGWAAHLRRYVPSDQHRLIEMEPTVTARAQFEICLVPDLLRVPEYARALLSRPETPADVLDRQVMSLLARQQVLDRSTPPRLEVILSEDILHRPVGGPRVMAKQLRHLTDLNDAISVRVLPRSVTISPALEGAFAILTLPDPLPPVAYAEGPDGLRYLESDRHVQALRTRFAILQSATLPTDESISLIDDAANTFRNQAADTPATTPMATIS